MCVYIFVCIVLCSMVLTSTTLPRENYFNQQSNDPFAQRTGDEWKTLNFQKRDVTTKRRERPPEGPIIFHGERASPKESRKDFSAEGKGMNCIENVCLNATDYPYDHIKEVIGNKLSLFPNIFGHFDGTYVDPVSKGNDGEPEAKQLCEVKIHTNYPKTLKSLTNVTKFIVNDGEYRQGLIFETCVEGAVPNTVSFPEGYEVKCVQKYATRRLLSIEADETGEPAFDSFVVPACCVCTYKQIKN